jgi:tetratricopeptide (TPR) repeat protein
MALRGHPFFNLFVMKKRVTYLSLLVTFFALTAFIIVRYQGKLKIAGVAYFPLKERKGPAAQLPEWTTIQANGNRLIRQVREKPSDTKAALQLASIYLQEARITGEYAYYQAAALKYIDDVLVLQPNDFNALVLKALVQLSQHHFSEAVQTAEAAVKVNPYNAFVYGLLVDGQVELGNYAKAVVYSDKMMSIRPDIRSYARVAYLREIHGDLPGAIEAMRLAVESGAYGEEGTEWCRVQLGQLYEKTGQLLNAKMHYTISLQQRPGYAFALTGLSRIALAEQQPDSALALAQRALATSNEPAIREQLASVYLQTGQQRKGEDLLKELIGELSELKETDGGINHHAGMELAYLYLQQGQADKALAPAQQEYNRRPDNIEVNEALGWVLVRQGKAAEALPYLQKALRTRCQNPVLLCRAGLAYAAAGNAAEAKRLLVAGLKNQPLLEPALREEAESRLRTL